MTIDIFCDVIDNYGDIGVCLRICRDLSKKNLSVKLFCNNLNSLSKIKNTEDISNKNLYISSWPDNKNISYEASEVVIQAFSTRLPDYIFNKIRQKKSLVINLEYLTAEPFADDCHKLPSYSDGYQSFFFFPGFTKKTGGVTIEESFKEKLKTAKKKNTVSLFCYENENIDKVISALNKTDRQYELLIFEGKPLDNFNRLYDLNLKVNDSYEDKNVKVKVLAMVSQDEYDDILINSCLNLVRGEDSIVRAMLTGNPFLWHIYFQEDDAHKDKINALFDRMLEVCSDKECVQIYREINLNYNSFGDMKSLENLTLYIERIEKICHEWQIHLLSLGSLSANLLNFIREKI